MNAPPRPLLRAVILAAGFSRRLGESKALARVRGVSLLRRTAALLAPLADASLLVVAPPRQPRFAAELRGLAAEIRVNARRDGGLSSSVRLAIAHAGPASALLIVPVDLPALRARELARLVARWRAAPRQLVARRIGDAGGTPLILPRGLFAAAAGIRGDVGLRDLVRRLPAAQRRFVAVPSAGADVDRPQDLRAARRRLGGPAQPRS